MDDLGAGALKYVARIYADHGPAMRRILLETAMEQIEDLPGMMPSVLAEISGVIECALATQLMAIVEDLDKKALELDEDLLRAVIQTERDARRCAPRRGHRSLARAMGS
jgi:hypothetical protein